LTEKGEKKRKKDYREGKVNGSFFFETQFFFSLNGTICHPKRKEKKESLETLFNELR